MKCQLRPSRQFLSELRCGNVYLVALAAHLAASFGAVELAEIAYGVFSLSGGEGHDGKD